ncbi:glycosyltransferase family 2 protein [Chryseobacterium sp. JAH]|uniref:glycosyltransferase family 2 protein n=1 Tax=Chryseobacterium sp. JAH TaxID=1742858 RepID=UPI000740CF97|nr:glycosyltransferase family 2 protein [Chryseobacterium sp. JAH]KUJ50503.1 hypothetical protein AR685_14505 [Chryseobacterium sp. JAH]
MKISVALCTYNGEKFLKQQLDSIIDQTVNVDEIIVCDDRSTDQTQRILSEYSAKFPDTFKIHINEKNLRSVKNFEKAISLCTGEIIFLSDQDDVWERNKVEVYIQHFQNNEKLQVICSNGFVIDDNHLKLDHYTVWDAPQFLEQQNKINHFKIFTLLGNYATGAAMAVKKSFAQQTLPFPDIESFHHDEWIAIVAAENDEFAFINEKLFSYRYHTNQQVGGIFFTKDEAGKQEIIRKYDLQRPLKNFRDVKMRFRSIRDKINKFENYVRNNSDKNVERVLQSVREEKINLEKKVKSENMLFFLFFKYLY